MLIYKLILTGSVFFLLISFTIFLTEIYPSKWRKNPARPLGDRISGVKYSFSGAMSPGKKESAYLHLPSYSAGIIFHLGLFTGFINLILSLSEPEPPSWLRLFLSIVLLSGSVSGLLILFKRIVNKYTRNLSNPDDFVSNLLVTGFQLISLLSLWLTVLPPFLFLFSSLLILYIPVGKLRHSFYFFSSRIALGIFYGTRGVWPQHKFKDE